MLTLDELLKAMWDIISKGADIVGFISLGISIVTLVNTGKIRSSMIAHAETSEYRKQIDEQISKLEAIREILVDGKSQEPQLFLQLITQLKNIRISYETILPAKLLRRIKVLCEYIMANLYDRKDTMPYRKSDLTKCISLLLEIISGLKKEKSVI